MKYTVDQIVDLYSKEAEKHGDAGTSTIQDIRTRNLEMDAIFSYIKDGMDVLEIGCGNGYVAERLVEKFDVHLDAFDFSKELIEIAQHRDLSQAKGDVRFSHDDVLKLETYEKYDLVFTERVLQNLLSWNDQQIALRNILHCLKKGGIFVMEECFWSGLNNLNAARAELDLDPIPESWHNLYFRELDVKEFMSTIGATFVEENCFLSGYYFGSRVLLPALYRNNLKNRNFEGKPTSLEPPKTHRLWGKAQPKTDSSGCFGIKRDNPVTSKSILNDYFCCLPPAGDFSPMKILVFRK